jgi:hypothetical protein
VASVASLARASGVGVADAVTGPAGRGSELGDVTGVLGVHPARISSPASAAGVPVLDS